LSTVCTEEIERSHRFQKDRKWETPYSPPETIQYSQLVIDTTKRITNKDKVLIKTISELINIGYLPALQVTKKKESWSVHNPERKGRNFSAVEGTKNYNLLIVVIICHNPVYSPTHPKA